MTPPSAFETPTIRERLQKKANSKRAKSLNSLVTAAEAKGDAQFLAVPKSDFFLNQPAISTL